MDGNAYRALGLVLYTSGGYASAKYTLFCTIALRYMGYIAIFCVVQSSLRG